MKRRATVDSSSLELLLDTICNTFGGILFIAILVCVMTQVNPANISKQLDEAALVDTEISQRQEQIAKLEETIARLKSSIARFVPAEMNQLLAELSALTSQSQRLESSLAKRQRELADQVARAASAQRSASQLDEEIRAAEQNLASVRKELADLKQSQRREIRLPRIHQANKPAISLSVYYGRVYLVHHYDADFDRLGLNTADFLILEENGGKIVVTPNPARGLPLSARPADREAVLALLQRFDPEKFFLDVSVRSDSFAVFHHLREAMKARGFEYRLLLTNPGDSVIDRGATDSNVQ